MAQTQARPGRGPANQLYGKLPARDIADIFWLVNGECNFLSVLTPLQPRYAKKVADEDSLMAVIMAQAMNLGNHAHVGNQRYPVSFPGGRASTIPAVVDAESANDRISNFVAGL